MTGKANPRGKRCSPLGARSAAPPSLNSSRLWIACARAKPVARPSILKVTASAYRLSYNLQTSQSESSPEAARRETAFRRDGRQCAKGERPGPTRTWVLGAPRAAKPDNATLASCEGAMRRRAFRNRVSLIWAESNTWPDGKIVLRLPLLGWPVRAKVVPMAKRAFRSLAELSAGIRKAMPVADLASHLQAAFHLPAASFEARRDGEALVLSTSDRTVRFALQDMDEQILGFLASRGYAGLRRVRWSAA